MTHQLQLWDRSARVYVPNLSNLKPETLAELGRAQRCAWRVVMCSKERPLVPRYRAPHSRAGADKRRLVSRYLDWAQARGVASVAVYRGDWWSLTCAVNHHLQVREVEPNDFIGPVGPAEVDHD